MKPRVNDRLLAPFEPTAANPFDLAKAGHLLRRAAFGGSLAERDHCVRDGVDAAVDALFDAGATELDDRLFGTVIAFDDIERLRAFWLWRMLRSPGRLRERVALFWHGHFATSNQKLNSPRLMAGQLDLLRRAGLGSFRDLLLGISRDPAMIRWLDNDTNVKGSPNENFARELFELFALGRGNYTEADIRDAARAFTGWRVRDHAFHFSRPRHDAGEKNVLGARGTFGGEDVVRLSVEQPASARFLATKLLAAFVHPAPNDDEVDAVAELWRRKDGHLGATLRVLLRSELFFSPRAYRSKIRSPVDLVVGRVLDCGGNAAPAALARAAARMGQTLLEPPSVEGWRGGREWLTSATWLLRTNFAAELFAGRGAYRLEPGAATLLEPGRGDPSRRVDLALRLLVDGVVPESTRGALLEFASGPAGRGAGGDAALLHAVSSLPEAQLL